MEPQPQKLVEHQNYLLEQTNVDQEFTEISRIDDTIRFENKQENSGNFDVYLSGLPVNISETDIFNALSEMKLDAKVKMDRDLMKTVPVCRYILEFEHKQEAEGFYATVNSAIFLGVRVYCNFVNPLLNFNTTSGSKFIVVKHLPLGVTSLELFHEVIKFGRVILSKVMLDRSNTELYALLQFENQDHAEQCIEQLDGINFKGNNLALSWQYPKNAQYQYPSNYTASNYRNQSSTHPVVPYPIMGFPIVPDHHIRRPDHQWPLGFHTSWGWVPIQHTQGVSPVGWSHVPLPNFTHGSHPVHSSPYNDYELTNSSRGLPSSPGHTAGWHPHMRPPYPGIQNGFPTPFPSLPQHQGLTPPPQQQQHTFTQPLQGNQLEQHHPPSQSYGSQNRSQQQFLASSNPYTDNFQKNHYHQQHPSTTTSNHHNQHQQDRRNLYIKNLDKEFTQKDLEQLFQPYGRILSSVILKDETTLISKGVGFVLFETTEQATNAITNTNGVKIKSKNIFVHYAEQKKIATLPVIANSTNLAITKKY